MNVQHVHERIMNFMDNEITINFVTDWKNACEYV